MCPYRQIWYSIQATISGYRLLPNITSPLDVWESHVSPIAHSPDSTASPETVSGAWNQLTGLCLPRLIPEKGKQRLRLISKQYTVSKRLLNSRKRQSKHQTRITMWNFCSSFLDFEGCLFWYKPCGHALANRTQQKLSGCVSRMASQETNLKAPMISWCDTSCANRTQHDPTMSSWFWCWSHLLLWYIFWCRRPACEVRSANLASWCLHSKCLADWWPSSKSYTKIMQTLVTSKNLWHVGTGMCGTVWSVWVHESPKSRSWKCEFIVLIGPIKFKTQDRTRHWKWMKMEILLTEILHHLGCENL